MSEYGLSIRIQLRAPRARQRRNLFSPNMNTLQSDKHSFFFLPQIYLSLRYLKLEHEEGALLTDVKLEGGHS